MNQRYTNRVFLGLFSTWRFAVCLLTYNSFDKIEPGPRFYIHRAWLTQTEWGLFVRMNHRWAYFLSNTLPWYKIYVAWYPGDHNESAIHCVVLQLNPRSRQNWLWMFGTKWSRDGFYAPIYTTVHSMNRRDLILASPNKAFERLPIIFCWHVYPSSSWQFLFEWATE